MEMNISEDLLSLVNNQLHADLEIYREDAGPLIVKLPLLVGMLIRNCCIWFSACQRLNIVKNVFEVTPQ